MIQRRRFNLDQVRDIRMSQETLSELARTYEVTRTTIRRIKQEETYKDKRVIFTPTGLERTCCRCKETFPLDTEHFYVKYGKFHYSCKGCFKDMMILINRRNRETRRILKGNAR